MNTLDELVKNLIEGREERVEELVRKTLADGINICEILDKGLIGGMHVVGERFKQAEIFVPEVLLAARAMKAGMNVLSPLLRDTEYQTRGRVILGTVEGDMHDIGKNLVGIMLSGAGFEVIDLGINVPPQKFVEAAIETKARVVGMSSLLTVTMPSLKTTIEGLKKAGLKNVKTIVGGATVTQKYADEIGADGYSEDAPSAIDVVKELIRVD
jgi:5-methyltetrahydrofolate--homocysteine methyltransferase